MSGYYIHHVRTPPQPDYCSPCYYINAGGGGGGGGIVVVRE